MNNIKSLIMFLKLSFRISPSYIVTLIISTIAQSGRVLTNVILPKFLIDELVGKRDIEQLIFWVALIVFTNLFFAFFNQVMKRTMDIKNIYMREKMSEAMARKIMQVEFSYLENPYYLDLKERAVFATNNQSAMENLINSVAKSLNGILTLVGLLTIMFTLSWVFVLLLLLTIGIILIVQKKYSKYQVQFFQDIIPVNRKYGYYVGLAFNDKIQKDIRMYGMNKMLTDRVRKYNEEINTWFSTFYRKQGKVMGFYGIINDLQATLAYGYVGLRVMTDTFGKRIGIGSFTMYVSAAVNFTTATMELGQSIITVTQMLSYLEPFMEFMSLPDEENSGGTIPFSGNIESIRFENVSFSYPNSQRKVLDHISFDIKRGEKISIVGLNGAGKTTLIKLICRLYHPTEGNIYINGHDIFEYDHRSFMKEIAAIFQDYKLFAFSVQENISCQDIDSNREKVLTLLDFIGMKEKVEKLPKGVRSMFGKAYDDEGIEMSGGEGQKIAIARALYKDASLIILDEPTSALDPIAEAEIYENFNHLVGDKTAIYISHRMSSSIFCDKILIIDNGKVSDYDTHRNLMQKKESLYYKLFQSQATNYQLN